MRAGRNCSGSASSCFFASITISHTVPFALAFTAGVTRSANIVPNPFWRRAIALGAA
jgi:hypothetical protein